MVLEIDKDGKHMTASPGSVIRHTPPSSCRPFAGHWLRASTRATCVANQVPVPRIEARCNGSRRSSATVGARSAARALARSTMASEAALRMALVIVVLRCFSDASAPFVRSEIALASCSATAARM
jgi:hypothetical protein